MLTVLSLCDFTGNWSRPYRDAGYDVRQIDLQHGEDVRLFKALPYPVRGVLAAPPCTEFSSSGARWWEGKGEPKLIDALALVDACCRIILMHRPQWWVIENPIGRLTSYLGEPVMLFDPADYGDPYTKRTCLWGPVQRAIQVASAGDRGKQDAPDVAFLGSGGKAKRNTDGILESLFRGQSMTLIRSEGTT